MKENSELAKNLANALNAHASDPKNLARLVADREIELECQKCGAKSRTVILPDFRCLCPRCGYETRIRFTVGGKVITWPESDREPAGRGVPISL